MAKIVLDQVSKVFGNEVIAVNDVSLGDRRRRVHGAGRTIRLRQVHDPADPRRFGGGHRRRGLHRRHAGHRPDAEGPGHRDGVPELRPLPAHERRAEPGVRPEAPQDAEGRAAATRAGRRPDPRTRSSDATQARRAVGRPAPAGRHRPRHGARAARVPDGRAPVEPGREAAGADARRTLPTARTARHHHGLRHARPGRGDDAGPPRRRAQGRRAAAGGHAAAPLPASRQPVRRGVHRLAAHEPGGGARSTAPA